MHLCNDKTILENYCNPFEIGTRNSSLYFEAIEVIDSSHKKYTIYS